VKYRILVYRRPSESTANELPRGTNRDTAIATAEAALLDGVTLVEVERWDGREWLFLWGKWGGENS
jgi:hypothetical protein